MRKFLNITKALSDEGRVRVLMFLREGELCVCEIVEMLGLAPSTVSKHLAILQQAELIDSRKDGRWIYYRLADATGSTCAGRILACAQECLAKNSQIQQDLQRAKAVRKMSKEDLCQHYRC